jgi:ribulose-phosphate 3-epimerase
VVQISASLLAADYACLGAEISRAEQAGVDSFHFDMMDGHYVQNLALTPQHLRALRPYTRLPFHVHLELEHPDMLLEKFNPLGADLVIVQWDTLKDPTRIFDLIRTQGAKVGLSINLSDPVAPPSQWAPMIDMFLVLGVEPGFGGQSMATDTCSRIRNIRTIAHNMGTNITIAVDGGVNSHNIPALLEAGADCLIMGTAIFQAVALPELIKAVRSQTQVLLG